MIGVIISFCPIFYMLSSLVLGKYLQQIGRKFALNVGLVMICIQLTMLGLLYYVESTKLFITLAMIAQATGGIGDGSISTTCLSLITTRYPEDKQWMIGIFESGAGLGLLMGPLIGSGLYKLGGYRCPFWTLTFVCICMFPLVRKMIKLILLNDDSGL